MLSGLRVTVGKERFWWKEQSSIPPNNTCDWSKQEFPFTPLMFEHFGFQQVIRKFTLGLCGLSYDKKHTSQAKSKQENNECERQNCWSKEQRWFMQDGWISPEFIHHRKKAVVLFTWLKQCVHTSAAELWLYVNTNINTLIQSGTPVLSQGSAQTVMETSHHLQEIVKE